MAFDLEQENTLATETWEAFNNRFKDLFTGDATLAVRSAIDDMDSGLLSDESIVNVWDSVRDSQYYGVVRAENYGSGDYAFELDVVSEPVRVNFKPDLNEYERDSSPYLGQSRYIDFNYNELTDTYGIRSEGIQFGDVDRDMVTDLRQVYVQLFENDAEAYELDDEFDDHMDSEYDDYGLDDYDF